MSEIQRYTPEPNYSNSLATSMANVALRKDFEGVVVLFTDHAKRVQELVSALREIGREHGCTDGQFRAYAQEQARAALRK